MKSKMFFVGVFSISFFILVCYFYSFRASEYLFEGPIVFDLSRLEKNGWFVEEVPLSNSDSLNDATVQLLQFSAYRQIRISKEGYNFFIFLVMWNPGSGHLRTSEDHNPDICWRTWRTVKRLENALMRLSTGSDFYRRNEKNCEAHSSDLIDSGAIWPIEYRFLEEPTHKEKFHTYFWHVWDHNVVELRKKSKSYLRFYLKILKEWLTPSDLIIRMRAARNPRWFVRIHSNTPLAPVFELENGELRKANGSTMLTTGGEKIIKDEVDDDDKNYLVDYPEVRELLASIHEMTTGETLVIGE